MTKHPPRKAFIILLVGLACSCTAATDEMNVSAWSAANAYFEDGFADGELRARLTHPAIRGRFVLPGRLDFSRYKFLRIARLNRLTDDRFMGEVDFMVDEWPWSLSFGIGWAEGKWLIDEVASERGQQRIITLLGNEGLPEIRGALPWNGGLAGRDATGRPTAPVVLVVVGGQVFVDGIKAVAYSRTPVVDAVRSALAKRIRIAKAVHANYWPHVALAMTRGAPGLMTIDLSQWAFEAGAQIVQLVVRRPDGTRGWLSVSKARKAHPDSRPRLARLAEETDGVSVQLSPPRPKGPGTINVAAIDAKILSRALAPTTDITGVLISLSPLTNYERLTNLVGHAGRALPNRPLGLEAKK